MANVNDDPFTMSSRTLSAQIKTSVADSVRNSIYDNFLTGLVQNAGVRTNQAALNQALALNGS